MPENRSQDETYVDQLLRKIKNNKIIAIIIIVGLIVAAVARFKEDIEKLIPETWKSENPQPKSDDGASVEFAGQIWLKYGPGHVSISEDIAEINDELTLSTHGGEVLMLSKRVVNLDQIAFVVQCELVSQDQRKGWGLVFWVEDHRNFHYFCINNRKQFRLLQFKDGLPRVLIPWTTSSLIAGSAGKIQRLRVDTNGSKIRLFMGNDLLTEYTVDLSSTGRVGLYVESRGLTVRYRDIRFERR